MVCMELLPEGFRTTGFFYTSAGLLGGVAMIILADELIRMIYRKNRKNGGTIPGPGKNPVLISGWMMVLAVALHNLPEGFAVGAGFRSGTGIGITLSAAILLHDIPEGMAMAIPLRMGRVNPVKVFLVTILSGIPMGIGAFLGAAAGGISDAFSSICLGIAGGAMLYVSLGELINESRSIYRGRFPLIGNMAGFLTGALISLLG